MDKIECFNCEKVSRLRKGLSKVSFSKESILLKALSNEKRLEVLHILNIEDCCVCDLSHIMECPVPTVSQYLRILKNAELVSSEKNGKFIIYSLTNKAQEILNKLGIMSVNRISPRKFDALVL